MKTPRIQQRGNTPVGPSESEISRQARLDEQREQRRSVITTAAIISTITVIIMAVAFTRLSQGDTGTKIVIAGTNESSTSFTLPSTTLPPSTTTSLPRVRVTGVPLTTTTVAPTTTTAITLPPNFGDLFTTTLPSTTTTAPPVTAPPAVADIQWSAAPNPATMQSGAQRSFSVTARNIGTGAGTVSDVTCATIVPSAGVCVDGRDVTIAPGSSKTWNVSISATSNGVRTGTPLAPGSYRVNIGGTSVALTVVP